MLSLMASQLMEFRSELMLFSWMCPTPGLPSIIQKNPSKNVFIPIIQMAEYVVFHPASSKSKKLAKNYVAKNSLSSRQ